ncbi:hypothetical protein VTI74DRAFT_449 [Chaetomium olivicolor]
MSCLASARRMVFWIRAVLSLYSGRLWMVCQGRQTRVGEGHSLKVSPKARSCCRVARKEIVRKIPRPQGLDSETREKRKRGGILQAGFIAAECDGWACEVMLGGRGRNWRVPNLLQSCQASAVRRHAGTRSRAQPLIFLQLLLPLSGNEKPITNEQSLLCLGPDVSIRDLIPFCPVVLFLASASPLAAS